MLGSLGTIQTGIYADGTGLTAVSSSRLPWETVCNAFVCMVPPVLAVDYRPNCQRGEEWIAYLNYWNDVIQSDRSKKDKLRIISLEPWPGIAYILRSNKADTFNACAQFCRNALKDESSAIQYRGLLLFKWMSYATFNIHKYPYILKESMDIVKTGVENKSGLNRSLVFYALSNIVTNYGCSFHST